MKTDGKIKQEKKRTPLVKKLGLLLVSLLLVLLALRICVPFYIENNLCAKIADALKVNSVHCDVRSFGITHLDISDIRAGDIKNPFVKIDSMRINYSSVGILFGKIESVAISGLDLKAGLAGGKFYIPGLDLDSLIKGGQPKKGGSKNLLPVTIEYCVIRNSELDIVFDGRIQRIPFEMAMVFRQASPDDRKKSDYEMSLSFYPRGEPVRVWGGFDLKGARAFCGMKTEDMTIARFQDLTDRIKGLKISGVVGFESAFDTSGNIGFSVEISELDLQYKGVNIINATDNSGKLLPLVIQMGIRKDALPFTFNTFRMQAPLPIDFSMDAPGGEIKITKDGISVATEIKASIDKSYFNSRHRSSSLKLKESEYCTLLFDADVDRSLKWHFNFSALHDISETVELESDTQQITCSPMILSVSGDGNNHSGVISYVMRIADIEWQKESGEFLDLPDLEFAGDLRFDSMATPVLIGNTIVSADRLSIGGMNCGKIEAMIPFRWPLVPGQSDFEENRGTLKTGTLKSGNSSFGYFDAILSQSDSLAWSIGGFLNTVFDNFRVDFSGEAGLDEGGGVFCNIDFEIPNYASSSKMDFGKVNPDFSGIILEGTLKTKGKIACEGGVLKTGAGVSLTDSTLSSSERNFKIEGLELFLSMQDLALFKSMPKQTLKFARMTAGTLSVESGEIEFQIESPKKYFIEKSGFSWCGGHVYSHAMRIEPGEDLEFILYCDRLNLLAVLSQLQAAGGTGDGTVNGRIPVKIKNGRLRFTDGFLYSSPGQGGNIKLGNSQVLDTASAIQKQNAQMAIVVESLKDFKYDWVRLALNSENRKLNIVLDINGKPAKPLNFWINSEGEFYQTDEGSGLTAKFESILFTINFSLPINRMLRYGKDFNEMIKGEQK
ncbi:MAG: hypothetical protein A2X48_15900 [Lentisphaerae bacterium GWF2_49_21]|nr:MAG: hypothetical protein A2X48_15900 [Lentisphaerae bacterium GWF2_49_21]